MRSEDGLASARASRDPEWLAQHPALDAALASGIRAPAADADFDREVWARIRTDAAANSLGSREPHRRFGAPLWLSALNIVAMGVVAVIVALVLGAAAQPAEQSARVARALLEHSPISMRVALIVASGIGLWLGLRGTPWARALGLSLGPQRVAQRR
jgi:hypothetical protein